MYKCLPKACFEDNGSYRLIPIRMEDIESIRLWRNAQIDILRQQGEISAEEQKLYFKQAIQPTFSQLRPKQILFSFFYNHACIGYGGLTHINWDSLRAEVSFLTDPQRHHEKGLYSQDFLHFLALLSEAAFSTLNLHKMFTETFSFRKDHIKILEEFGFKPEGVLRDHIYINGRWYDSIMHSMLAKEWNDAK